MEFRPIRYYSDWGPSEDYSCKVWFILAQWFQRRRLKCEQLKETDDGCQTTDDKSSP
jgi:hypothetical protein